jgi:hypothetical protein
MISRLEWRQTIPLSTWASFPPAPFLLDTYPDAAFAYSFRKLRTAYAGSAVRIRESGGNTEADIGFDGSGDFDTAAAAAHIGANSGFIVTWYDQSGNGFDVTQATAANQPAYDATGISSLPMASYDGANYFLADTSVALFPLMSSQGTILSVMQQDGSVVNGILFDWHEFGAGTEVKCYATFGDSIYFDFGSETTGRVNVAQPGSWDNTPHVLELYRDSSDDQAIVVDGTSLVNATLTVDTQNNSGHLYIGQRNDANFRFGGFIAELVAWGTDLAGNRANARANLNSYYSVF